MMKVEKKESSPCVLALSVKAEAAEIKEEYQKVLTAFIRNAIVPASARARSRFPSSSRSSRSRFRRRASRRVSANCTPRP